MKKLRLTEATNEPTFIINGGKAWVDVYEDSYEEGEGNQVSSYDISLKGSYTLKELMKEFSYYGFSDKPSDYGCWYENGYSELMTDALLCEDNTEPSKSELESWKKGELELFTHRMSCHLQIGQIKDLNDEDMKNCGFQTW